jgi:hypothetical protein
MFRMRARRPPEPKVYRISACLTVLALAFALAVAFSLPSGP